jgi:hypothetical protein
MGQVMADASQDQLGKAAASTSTGHYEVRFLVIGGVHDHRRRLTDDDEDTVLGLRGTERRTPLGNQLVFRLTPRIELLLGNHRKGESEAGCRRVSEGRLSVDGNHFRSKRASQISCPRECTRGAIRTIDSDHDALNGQHNRSTRARSVLSVRGACNESRRR